MTPRRYAKHDQSYQNGTPAHAPEVQSCRSRRSSGLQGDLSLTTRDGNVTLDHLSGDLRIKSGDGQVKITNADGATDAHTSDGSLSVDGLFHALALHTSDGTLEVSLREGTQLAGGLDHSIV
jgi:DUF4097 and DUF4098 domain-containing protein YvlB